MSAMDSQTAVVEDVTSARHVAAFFEKFDRDRYESQELLSFTCTNWLLSNDDIKVISTMQYSLITNFTIFKRGDFAIRK